MNYFNVWPPLNLNGLSLSEGVPVHCIWWTHELLTHESLVRLQLRTRDRVCFFFFFYFFLHHIETQSHTADPLGDQYSAWLYPNIILYLCCIYRTSIEDGWIYVSLLWNQMMILGKRERIQGFTWYDSRLYSGLWAADADGAKRACGTNSI